MNCPHCDIQLITRKTFNEPGYTFRVKQCPECKRYYKTYERTDFDKAERENRRLKGIVKKIRELVG